MIFILAIALFGGLDFSSVDLVQRGKVRWSKLDGGERVTVQIQAGNAARMNPNWSPKPEKLAYDLDRNRVLERALKAARLGGVGGRESDGPSMRTLEIAVLDRNGDWHDAGKWTLPIKSWRKGKLGAVYDLLEPMLSVKPELFETIPQKEPEPQ
jgi:hypothetical protein